VEFARLKIRIGGDVQNEIVKSGLTPAEVLLLKHMHGDDAILDVAFVEPEKRNMVKRTGEADLARLRDRYTSPTAKASLHALFPGLNPNVPTTFDAIGIKPLAAAPVVHAEPGIADLSEPDEEELRLIAADADRRAAEAEAAANDKDAEIERLKAALAAQTSTVAGNTEGKTDNLLG
jgi:hypothetical protein